MNTSWSCFSVQSPRQEAHKNDSCAASVCRRQGRKSRALCAQKRGPNPTGEMGDQESVSAAGIFKVRFCLF